MGVTFVKYPFGRPRSHAARQLLRRREAVARAVACTRLEKRTRKLRPWTRLGPDTPGFQRFHRKWGRTRGYNANGSRERGGINSLWRGREIALRRGLDIDSPDNFSFFFFFCFSFLPILEEIWERVDIIWREILEFVRRFVDFRWRRVCKYGFFFFFVLCRFGNEERGDGSLEFAVRKESN